MGNMIIGQSGGPTAVINSSLAGAIKAAKLGGVEHIYGMRFGIEGLLQGQVVELGELFTDLYDLSLLKRTPAAFLGSLRRFRRFRCMRIHRTGPCSGIR